MPESKSNAQLGVTDIRTACRTVAAEFYGARGLWIYDSYEALNRQLFGGKLPTALIAIELTAHGRCLGLTQARDCRLPRVALHPSTFGGTESANPWGVSGDVLGHRYALDVLIHEMVHVSVIWCHGGAAGPSSHNCPRWRSEVERIAPLIGLEHFSATASKTKRVDTGQVNAKGKPIKQVRRVDDGDFPYAATYRFPHEARKAMGRMNYYRDGRLKLDLPKFPETHS